MASSNTAEPDVREPWELAVEAAREKLGDAPLSADLFLRAAASSTDEGRVGIAEAILTEGMARWPDNVWFYYHHARLGTLNYNFATAFERWRRVQELFPASPEGLCGFADFYRHHGREEEAAHRYEEAHRRFPDYVWAADGAASSATRRRDWPEAIKRWTEARKLFPEHIRARLG
jgi:tetratricopeptide (TPR) repeat protein